MKCLRMYADQNGDSHFEDVEVEMSPIGSHEASALQPCTAVGFRQFPPGYATPRLRAAARRLLVFILAGEVELAVSDGTVRRVGPGGVVLIEDTSGKGHSAREVGTEPSLQAIVQLTD